MGVQPWTKWHQVGQPHGHFQGYLRQPRIRYAWWHGTIWPLWRQGTFWSNGKNGTIWQGGIWRGFWFPIWHGWLPRGLWHGLWLSLRLSLWFLKLWPSSPWPASRLWPAAICLWPAATCLWSTTSCSYRPHSGATCWISATPTACLPPATSLSSATSLPTATCLWSTACLWSRCCSWVSTGTCVVVPRLLCRKLVVLSESSLEV